MNPHRDQLILIIKLTPVVRDAVTAMNRASLRKARDEERVAFHVLQDCLAAIAQAIDTLPADLIRAEPGVPWHELSRLPALLSRPDFEPDAKVIRGTLEIRMRDLKNAAHRLLLYQPPR
jgi:hypothetical protein